MRKAFADALKKQLAPFFEARFPDFLPYNHPNFQTQCTLEYLQPVEVGVASRAVAEQLESTAAVIEQYVLPLFAELEQRANMPGSGA